MLSKFKTIFKVGEDVENFDERYKETFEKFRNQKALSTYLRSLKALPTAEKEDVQQALNQYVNAVLTKKFPEIRYQTEKNEHLEKIFSDRVDLKKAWTTLKEMKKVTDSYTLSVTDDECDLLLVGTDVEGSCQNVKGDATKNKCLVGYLLNGETQAIVMKKDKSESIDSRCLLRLLWDDKHHQPILLLEGIYPTSESGKDKETLICGFAKEIANKLKLPLVSNQVSEGELYDGRVQFLGGGIAPFTYADSADGVMDAKTSFEFKNTHLLSA